MEWARCLFPAKVISIRSDPIDFPLLRLVMVMNGENSRSGSHLSSLTLKATNALLSPLGSHLRRWFETEAGQSIA
ncbi:uncharacterized protein P174DRAFT_92520 [Aspergillus novofumigatus IBT 16806]|uniref:Uncharacterized protein n=1 Tax=Aspergillus novofumigatus (strain IBT 16806) TaxID=1392255 RepID=A0A2I1CGR8_ASPN1|nr:uncharacterized protein P174DRAFT_92520 [Aspergillus novofumigatus IBT 16806]PKX96821.1 hypothetical protein P174DRAFT_92520 [Aspergillus novofumigatus IBT 16806]